MSDKRNENVAINWKRTGILALVLAFLVLIGIAGFAYFQLMNINLRLASQVKQVEKRAVAGEHQLENLRQLTASLQQTMSQSQILSNRQEQLIAEWQSAQKGDLSRWYLAEAQYLIRLANNHAQFTGNIPSAVFLLQRAEQFLSHVHQSAAVEIKQSLAADIARLQASSPVNMTNIYLQLASLNTQLDQLSLPARPLSKEANQETANESLSDASWWQQGLARSWQALRQIIIVRQLTNNNQPVVLPEEKVFLNQNLHAKLEAAMWALLHRDQVVYQHSLSSLADWIKQYYVQDAQETKAVLQHIDDLSKMNIQPPVVNMTTTLQLLDKYFFAPTNAT